MAAIFAINLPIRDRRFPFTNGKWRSWLFRLFTRFIWQPRGKDSYSYQHNYVDRVRLEDTTGGHHHSHHLQATHDPRCPQLRAAGWRHTHKSVSHLDLATSCHDAAGSGLGRHSQQLHHHHSGANQSQHHQQQQNHHHLHHSHPHHPHAQPHWTQCQVGVAGSGSGNGQLRNARSLDYTQLEREENALDIAEFYWRFDAEAPLDQVDSYAVLPTNDNFDPSAVPPAGVSSKEATTTGTTTASSKTNGGATTISTTAAANALLDILGSESCSLRRSRSLAVIREETFSDLQIGSANSSRRRSQLIPRARLVNRGFFRESPRLNGKPNQATLVGEQPADHPADDTQSQRSNSGTCDSHQQQQQNLQQQHQQQQQQHQRLSRESRDFDVYYDNLKRLDALALNLSEQLHPWHNDKSDLESLNSDYFKNSLHQNHLDQQQPSSLEFEALEQVAVTLLKERPRIYQSRRQQQQRNHLHHANCLQRHLDTGGESCPEHSQSSVFPETTTSNSDDQTDSPSLSEQEYDLTHIEEIYQQGNHVEESYELISLTTTTRTRFGESSEEGEEEEGRETGEEVVESLTTPTEVQTSDSDSTLRQNHTNQLDKLIAYDSVYLSSEDSSDCTLIGESCESFEQRTFTSCGESGELETRSLLHISIEDTVYEPQAKLHKKGSHQEDQPAPPQLTTTAKVEAQIFTQVLKVEHTPKPKILAAVEKRKLKQEEQGVKQPPSELKRQATDSFVVTANKSNLTENQYHSLPDVNIGVSLKVCENIDKELRSSYNQQRQQQRKEAKKEQQVTRAETYDSIRRFGRAHQKARQREYQEREREREREASVALQEKEREKEKPKINKEFSAQERQIEVKETSKTQELIKEKEEVAKEEPEGEEKPLPPPPPPLTEESQPEDSQAEVEEEDNLSNLSIAQPEQPKEAPVIEVANFSRLIERRAQEIRERQEQIKPSFHIIVTDAQNNIIQKEAIQEGKETAQRIKPNPKTNSTACSNSNTNSSCNPIQRPLRRSVSSSSGKPLEHRILSTGAPIYKARPVKVLPSSSSDSSFSRGKMSRPQILHVVDGRGGVAGGAGGTLRRRSSARSIASTISSAGGEVANEYLQKVDAVRCYWNKLAGNEPETLKTEEQQQQQPAKETQPGIHFQLGGETTTHCSTDKSPNGSDFCSMMPHPSIEIVELGEGAQRATIVKAAPEQDEDADEDQDQFDHIRYKVLKSQQLIRNNFLSTRNKKEAQFDGLIQYLQEYSFQELLSNNNVVIVEPVRTKIERPLQVGINCGNTSTTVPPPKPPRVANASSAQPRKTRQRQTGGAASKRHFFYQPVRVNRELYEDELPDPDTVRNVRRFFEQNVLPTPGQGLLVQSQQKFGGSACQLSPKSRRARGYRYLTIDTSYGGAGEEQPKGMEMLEEHKAKHWDNASLSSGISSGDLSSPCGEYHHQQQESPVMACKDVHVQDVVRRHNSNAANAKARAKFASRRTWCMGTGPGNESLYRQIYENNLGNSEQQENGEHLEEEDDEQDDQYEDDVEQDMCENYYVSNDVLAKIRECGSTVTYYGGRVLDKTATSSTAPPTKATQPMTGSGTRSRIRQIEACNVCLPSERCEHRLQTKQAAAEQQQDSYQGIKFKLVKSNSCSSRLELAGTGEDEVSADSEVVRKMVHHFEANQTSPGNDVQLTINSQSQITSAKEPEEKEEPSRRQVTVNNHINVLRDMPQEPEKPENFNGQSENGYGAVETMMPTYESQAMNIRLDVTESRRNLQAGDASSAAANKVCRNKNVDLAYTLVKTTTNPPKGKPIEAPRQKIGKPREQREAEENGEKNAVTKSVKLAKAAPQIIVPVDIHSQASIPAPAAPIPERRLSNASSSNSVVDKSMVRHYVANDKSIYERRKYDEIEFEEFEVYDPSKEPPPQVEEGPEKIPTDAELYDSLDDKM
ncbi:protein javelin [Drosophila biarmipes]|uniref:protein javelin n=1 Tax=Drosophila biarmipes TaxID=125945 RepID=UPI0021CC6943|nr:protein javelin [Drosophila biarmipes]